MDSCSTLRLANAMDIETFREASAGMTTCHWVMRPSSQRRFPKPSCTPDSVAGTRPPGVAGTTGGMWLSNVVADPC